MYGLHYDRTEKMYHVSNGGGGVKAYAPEAIGDILQEIIEGTTNESIVLSYQLRLYGESIIKLLKDSEYKDMSTTDLMPRQMKSGSFSYIVSLTTCEWFNITIKNAHGVLVKFIDFCKMVSTENADDIAELSGIDDDLSIQMIHAIENLQKNGVKKTTLSSSAFDLWYRGKFYKDTMEYAPDPHKGTYRQTITDYPKLIDASTYDLPTGESLDEYLRPAYNGGWNYMKPNTRKHRDVYVYDVNSLYPWASMDEMPFGKPHYSTTLPARKDGKCIFVRFECSFYLKEGYLPFIRINNDFSYNRTDILTSSMIVSKYAGEVFDEKVDPETGEISPITATLTMTLREYELMHEHYDVENEKIIDCVWFYTSRTILGWYAELFYDKRHRPGLSEGERFTYKILQNGLLGYFGKRRTQKNKIFFDPDIASVTKQIKTPSFLYMGVAVTSYARCKIVRDAQKHYDTFLYSDTDSLHLSQKADDLQISDKIGDWKIEHEFSEVEYYGLKRYIGKENGKYRIVYAGLPEGQMERICSLIEGTEIPKKIAKKSFSDIVNWCNENPDLDESEHYEGHGVMYTMIEGGPDFMVIEKKTHFDMRLGRPEKPEWFKRTMDGKRVSKSRKKAKRLTM